MKYQVILVDPPWFYNLRKAGGERHQKTKFGGGAMKHYPLMKDQELLDLKPFINNIADDRDCIMFMWCTPPRLDFAINLLKYWGFTYKTKAFTWIKINKDGSFRSNPGFYTASNSEDLLICTKGKTSNFARPNKKMINQIISEPIREHSRKPDIVREYIEMMYPNYQKIELFSRTKAYNRNWTVWGDEINKFNKIEG